MLEMWCSYLHAPSHLLALPQHTALRDTIKALTGLDLTDHSTPYLLHNIGLTIKKYKGSLIIHLQSTARSCIPVLWGFTILPLENSGSPKSKFRNWNSWPQSWITLRIDTWKLNLWFLRMAGKFWDTIPNVRLRFGGGWLKSSSNFLMACHTWGPEPRRHSSLLYIDMLDRKNYIVSWATGMASCACLWQPSI